MRGKTYFEVIQAFLRKSRKKVANTHTENGKLYLFNNLIAEFRGNDLYITDAGQSTVTTKARLNMLPNVNIKQISGTWYLNGIIWDGKWIKIN